ncbi:hypothetical protein [Corynebacterium glyciniphilum]|uniref:hypothetical protein n=1 Tax=Corynebacterium glyciniphilum TaxID=1404244 RepID=UPI0034E979FC
MIQRARIILLAADGMASARTAYNVGTTTTSVWKWCNRSREGGVAALDNVSCSVRTRPISDLDIVNTTPIRSPKKYGVLRWSSRLSGQHLGLRNATVSRAWRAYGRTPGRRKPSDSPPISN